MKNEEITETWQQTFCQQMFGIEYAEKMRHMIRGAIDGYIAHYRIHTHAVTLHSLW